mgnify:CR=1 FL=1
MGLGLGLGLGSELGLGLGSRTPSEQMMTKRIPWLSGR